MLTPNHELMLYLHFPLWPRGPFCFASSTIRWVELESLSIVWWVCCVDHSLFQIIFVCPLRSHLPLNAKPSVDAVGEYECGSCEWSTNPPVRLSLNLNPFRRPSQKPRSLCVCVCAFFLSLWFLRSNYLFKVTFNFHPGWPNLWWNTENPVTLRSRAASLFR